jgi:hypothetical protein
VVHEEGLEPVVRGREEKDERGGQQGGGAAIHSGAGQQRSLDLPEICTPACADAWSQGINSDPWSDHHVDLTQLVAEGDHVVAIVETRERIVGTYYGVPGRGKPFMNMGAVVYRFENQKIASVDLYFDDLRIVSDQLGATLVPPPG